MAQDTTDTITPDRPEQLWTIDQAAEFMQMCDDTARPLLEDVAIRFSKRKIRYDPRDVWALSLSLKGAGGPKSTAPRSMRPQPPRPFTPSGGVVRRTTTKATGDDDAAEDVTEDEEAA